MRPNYKIIEIKRQQQMPKANIKTTKYKHAGYCGILLAIFSFFSSNFQVNYAKAEVNQG